MRLISILLLACSMAPVYCDFHSVYANFTKFEYPNGKKYSVHSHYYYEKGQRKLHEIKTKCD